MHSLKTSTLIIMKMSTLMITQNTMEKMRPVLTWLTTLEKCELQTVSGFLHSKMILITALEQPSLWQGFQIGS